MAHTDITMSEINVLFISGRDQKYGSGIAAVNTIKSVRLLYPMIKFYVATEDYGEINEFCDENGILNVVSGHKYCTYRKETNALYSVVKHLLKMIYVSVCNKKAISLIKKTIPMQSIDVIHTNLNRILIGCMLSKQYGIPQIMHIREFYNAHFNLKFLYPNQSKIINQHTSRYIAVSQAVANDWIAAGLDGRKMSVVYDGVEEKKILVSTRTTDERCVQLIMCGAIYEAKGQELLIRAVNELPNEIKQRIHVDFYGDGKATYVNNLIEYINRNYLTNYIRFYGYDPNVKQKMHNYDIGLMCSKAEGFGLVTAEYMLAGICPIVSNTGANQELVKDGVNGLVFEYGNIKSLAEKIEYLVRNGKERVRMANLARENALANYTITRCAENIYQIYLDESNNNILF